jgi:thiamine biosynthesis lipoprotein
VSPAFERFRALGTTALVGTTDADKISVATAIALEEIEACDMACSRFRDDSELSRLNNGERIAPVSEWLCAATATALAAAEQTGGLVDPTIGQALIDLGYDRTFDKLDPDHPLVVTATHVPAWREIRVNRHSRTVSIPSRVKLDLGATAKALCADRAAARAATATGTGVLVSLGGDISVCGAAPEDGWVVRVTDRSDSHPAEAVPGQTVAIRTGGLATSGTSARRWARAGAVLHHLVDPRTGQPAEEEWRTVSVAAPSCVAANTASTAAMILGSAAPAWLTQHGFDARLVTPDGEISTTGGWPVERRSRQEASA